LVRKTVSVNNRKGLHMRPAEQLVRTASRFESEITLVKDAVPVNGKSILGVMMLAAEYGSSITVEIDGPDETDALKAITEMFDQDQET